MKKVSDKKEITLKDLAQTIDNLAIMTAKGFSGLENEMNSKFEEVHKEFEIVHKEIAETRELTVATRRDVLDIGDKFVGRNEFDNLLFRFNKLEEKVRTKIKS